MHQPIRKFKRFYVSVIILIVVMLRCVEIKASKPAVEMKKGIIKFTTTDTSATSSITWATVGFMVTKERCLSGLTANEGYPRKMRYGSLSLRPEWKQAEEDISTGKTYVTFTIPESVVNKALLDAGLEEIEKNEVIYLHGIHQVKHQGKPYGSPKYDYPSICNAEKWANPNDFKDRFDIPVYYEGSGPQPVKITYVTDTGAVIRSAELPRKNWVELGDMVEVVFEKTIPYEGKTLYLAKSYQCFLEGGGRIAGTTNSVTGVNAKDYNQQLPRVRIRKKKQAPGGLEFVAVMREKRAAPDKEDKEGISGQLTGPAPYGVIGADERYREAYDVSKGIPVTEDLYANVFSDNYLLGYRFKRIAGEKRYRITVEKTYHLSWKEEEEDGTGGVKEVTRTAKRRFSKPYVVIRPYSYWIIENMDYYRLFGATLDNYALPGGRITLKPQNYEIPELSFHQSSDPGSHIREPSYSGVIHLGSETVSGKEMPSEDFQREAEASVGKVFVRNDSVLFDGTVVMEADWRAEAGKRPSRIPEREETIDKNVLYRSGMAIDKTKANGRYPSSGTVMYERVQAFHSQYNEVLSYPISGVPDVVVHTPVVCDGSVSDEIAYNQMIEPDRSVAGLVLDRSFTLCLPTEGSHRYITGYGYRDYARYTAKRQVRFPFDVYRNTDYYPAGTWILVQEDYTSFYLPIWVDEGKYTIQCKTQSISAEANRGAEKAQPLANLELSDYAAEDVIQVEISGRLYGFSLYDISDYPLWRTVFRMPNSLKPSGFTYTVGTKNQNGLPSGRKADTTFPLLRGSHPSNKTEGVMKGGYTTRFYLTTIGNMYGDRDYIHIIPHFYYLGFDGGKRKEVDLYYMETINGKYKRLIKVGSTGDRENIKMCRAGDPYLGISSGELRGKAEAEGRTLEEIRRKTNRLFTFGDIVIRGGLRFYTGNGCAPDGKIPAQADRKKAAKSRQKWYGEYYLPSHLYAAPKNYDVSGYAKKNRIDLHEAFWLKNGYLAVNFEIETIQNKKRHLSYLNPENAPYGYCNMWKMEGFSYQKTDSAGWKGVFQDGDYVLYDLRQSAAGDYESGGTH